MNKRIGKVGIGILLVFVGIAIFAPLIAPYNPYESVESPYLAPSSAHILGTNDIGQDIFSEIIYGTRTSLGIGFASALISISIGASVGMLSGWYGGRIDRLLMKVTAFFMVIPFIPAVIILSAFMKPGPITTSVILGVMSWAGTARVVRSQIMTIRKKEYIQAIKAMGAGDFFILTRHVLKEILPYLFYQATGRVRSGILMESSLSFLGLGSTVTKSWGTIIYYAQAKNALLTDTWLWWILPPGLCIILISCALTMISYGVESKINRGLETK